MSSIFYNRRNSDFIENRYNMVGEVRPNGVVGKNSKPIRNKALGSLIGNARFSKGCHAVVAIDGCLYDANGQSGP